MMPVPHSSTGKKPPNLIINESPLNQEALNAEDVEPNPEPESITGLICIQSALTTLGDPFGRIVLQTKILALDLFRPICITNFVHQRSVDGNICITNLVHQRTVQGIICIRTAIRELPLPVGPHGIPSSTPSGVLPQTGSAIFTSWQETTAKEILVHRHWDFHESGRANFDDNRKGWRLEMNVTGEKQAEVAAFFVSHVWAGKSFYFYDMQANGFQYDATGVLTDGRYKVRFVDENFPRVQGSAASGESAGGRFTIPFSIIEVD